ncbi:hypothetical protein AVEN_127273-1 [Araneus ventricosus]|uniref:Prokineticin domain-containing protein n=1 Tax=Araneus ventricosus TaxID=182803 RepID=A0A4Y2N2R1_ARAVE|nr:hypothetical protein AVEN_127273-1 [Araneus ventricosus]
MNAAFSSFFLVLLAALCVQCQEGEECGFAKIKCRKNQYCFRPKLKLDLDLGVCLPYLRKGALCDDNLRCSPELECREVNVIIKFKTCQEPSSKPTDDGISTVPDSTYNPPEESTFNTEPSDAPEPSDTPEPEISEEPEEP